MTLSTDFYLIVDAQMNRYGSPNSLNTPRVTKKKPATKSNEIAILCTVSLPNALFTRPQFEASIKVSDDQVTQPVVPVEVVDNIERLVLEQLGINLCITEARPT